MAGRTSARLSRASITRASNFIRHWPSSHSFQAKSDEVLDEQTEKHLYHARMQSWIALATGDDSRWQQADDEFKLMDGRLSALIANTADLDRLAKAKGLPQRIADLITANKTLWGLKGKNTVLDTPEAKAVATIMASGTRIDEAADPLAEAMKKAQPR